MKFACRYRKQKTARLLIAIFLIACAPQFSRADDPRTNLSFAGHVRKIPKTSIVRNQGNGIMPESSFQSLKELRDDLATINDARIRAIYRGHGGFPDDHRVLEELKNVKLPCWVYAIKFEGNDDNDFHVIISNTSAGSDGVFMTAEISGLPARGRNRAPLKKARKDFLDMMSNVSITAGSFVKLDNPVKVVIHGSLLFDNHHGADVAGPSWAKPHTSWEIHPVYDVSPGQ